MYIWEPSGNPPWKDESAAPKGFLPNLEIIAHYTFACKYFVAFASKSMRYSLLTLSLLVAGALAANYHYLAVSFDYLALVAHRLD